MDLFEIVIVLAIALVVLGPERLPEVLRTVGKILRELRAASNTVMRELNDVLEDQPDNANSGAPPPLEDPARATRPAVPQPRASGAQAPQPPAAPSAESAAPAVPSAVTPETTAAKSDPPGHEPS
ncbi:MAG: Sec-independent protein translocase subunit TatA/TatB [Candidatus Binataceae bacterium]